MNDLQTLPAFEQSGDSQAIAKKGRAPRRRRIAAIHKGALLAMDAAVEARCDTEQVSGDFETRRPDVQDLFAWGTRKQLRQVQGFLRSLDARLQGIEDELRGRRGVARRSAA